MNIDNTCGAALLGLALPLLGWGCVDHRPGWQLIILLAVWVAVCACWCFWDGIRANLEPDEEPTWSPFDADGHLDEDRLADKGWRTVGAIIEPTEQEK